MAEKSWLREHLDHLTKTALALLVVGGLSLLLPAVRDFLSRVPGYSHRFYLYMLMTTGVTRWRYWCLISMAIALLLVLALRVLIFFAGRGSSPTWHSYVEDDFFGIVWSWSWGIDGRLDPDLLIPKCSACDRILRLSYSRPPFGNPTTEYCCVCSRSDSFNLSHPDLLDKVAREIDLKVRKGTWKQKTSGGAGGA